MTPFKSKHSEMFQRDVIPFYFCVIDRTTSMTHQGTRYASSALLLYRDLQSEGWDILSLTPKRSFVKERFFSGRLKLSHREKILFFFQGGHLLKAGVPLLECLMLLSHELKDPQGQQILWTMREGLKEGLTLSQSMEKVPHVFPFLVRSLVHLGERTGDYTVVFESLAQYLKAQEADIKAFKKAIQYPFFLGITVLTVLLLFLAFLGPELGTFLRAFRTEIPWYLETMIQVGGLIQKPVFWMLSLCLIVFCTIFIWRFRDFIKPLISKLPILREVIQKQHHVSFLRTLTLLMRHHMDLPRSLKILEEVEQEKSFKNTLQIIQTRIREGVPFSMAIHKTSVDHVFLRRVIQGGEKSGQMLSSLLLALELEESDLKEKMDNLIRMIEPTLTILLGFILIGVVFIFLWPLYENLGDMDVF